MLLELSFDIGRIVFIYSIRDENLKNSEIKEIINIDIPESLGIPIPTETMGFGFIELI